MRKAGDGSHGGGCSLTSGSGGRRERWCGCVQEGVLLALLHRLPEMVLACLHTIIRKCLHERVTGNDIESLFPCDLSNELQSILVMLLQKYQDQWIEEASRDQEAYSAWLSGISVDVSETAEHYIKRIMIQPASD